jgi:hypothetical protein
MMTTKAQKTKLCPYCDSRINLQRALKVASANNAFKASAMLKKLKSEQGFETTDY